MTFEGFICVFSIVLKSMLKIDLEALCQDLAESESIIRTFRCNECEYTSQFRSNLDRHKKSIHLKSKKECNVCFKEFSEQSLKAHIELMHIENKKEFPCQICGTILSTSYTLKQH